MIVDSFASPEDINDGPNTFPSKRIKDQFPDYKKLLAGVKAAELIGLPTIRAKCPHFNEWVTKLERIGESQV
jgi:hypothetical protein